LTRLFTDHEPIKRRTDWLCLERHHFDDFASRCNPIELSLIPPFRKLSTSAAFHAKCVMDFKRLLDPPCPLSAGATHLHFKPLKLRAIGKAVSRLNRSAKGSK
jgi:hypothetical protein